VPPTSLALFSRGSPKGTPKGVSVRPTRHRSVSWTERALSGAGRLAFTTSEEVASPKGSAVATASLTQVKSRRTQQGQTHRTERRASATSGPLDSSPKAPEGSPMSPEGLLGNHESVRTPRKGEGLRVPP